MTMPTPSADSLAELQREPSGPALSGAHRTPSDGLDELSIAAQTEPSANEQGSKQSWPQP